MKTRVIQPEPEADVAVPADAIHAHGDRKTDPPAGKGMRDAAPVGSSQAPRETRTEEDDEC